MEKIEALSNFSDEANILSIGIGYTQGELDEDMDYSNSFRAPSHVIWKFARILDPVNGETDIFVNSKTGETFTGDETEIAEKIGAFCESESEMLFGRTIPAICFQSIVQAAFDDGPNDLTEQITEEIGGDVAVEYETDEIEEEYINALFCYIEGFEAAVKDNKLYIDDTEYDPNTEFETEDKTYALFTEDAMGYEG